MSRIPVERGRSEPGEDMNALAQAVIGAAIEEHRHLGPGYLESVEELALAVEFRERRILFERQKPIEVKFKGGPVGEGRLDFLVEERLIVELKAVEELSPIHRTQVLSYLRTAGLFLGLLIIFKVSLLRDGIKRVILS